MSARLLKNLNFLWMGIIVLHFMVKSALSLEPNTDIIETVNEEISRLRDYKKDYDSKQLQNIETKVSQFIINERSKLRYKLVSSNSFQYIYDEIKKPLNYSKVCIDRFYPSAKFMDEIRKIYQDCADRMTFNKTELSQKVAGQIEEGIKLKEKLDGIKMSCFFEHRKPPNPDEIKICLNNNGILLVEAYLEKTRLLSLEGYAESLARKCLEEPIVRHRTDKTIVANAQACEKNHVG